MQRTSTFSLPVGVFLFAMIVLVKKYKIHFVCRGNIYRSRLAEAIVLNLRNPKVVVSSSGISIEDNPGITIAPYAAYAAGHYKVDDVLVRNKTQTSNSELRSADIIVFLSEDVYEDAKKLYHLNSDKCVIWNVQDMGERLEYKQLLPNRLEDQ